MRLNRKMSVADVTIALVMLALAWAFVELAPWQTLWARMIGPFDQRPKTSVADMLNRPDLVREKRAEMCAWARREELRRPGHMTSAMRESACR